MSSSSTTTGARVSIQDIEKEVFKSPLQEVKDSGKSYKGKKGIVIEGFDFTVNQSGEKQLYIGDCQDVTIRRCRFRDKNTLGQGLNITGEDTKRVIVEYCIFENLSYSDDNGGEPLRIGNSQYSGCVYNCTVRKCIFRNLSADPETISIKSCGNIIEDCYHINNKSMITVRHGGLATIQYNTFQGSGGVRLLGYGNKVLNNLFKDNRETGKLSPIQVQNGVSEKDPNWTDVSKPSGKEGKSHAIYARCVDNEIIGNEFVNCRNKIYYRSGNSLHPLRLRTDSTASTGHEEQQPQAPIPEQPEPEPPVQPPPAPARLCQVCGKAEAKKIVGIWTDMEHVEPTRQELGKALLELRRKVQTGEIKVESEEE